MLQGSRIAYVVETSNAKPHAVMYIRTLHYTSLHDQYNKGLRKHTHEAFTIALFLTNVKNLRDSETSKPKRQVNAFFIMLSPPTNPVGVSDAAKVQHYFELANLVCTKTLMITKTDLIYHLPCLGDIKRNSRLWSGGKVGNEVCVGGVIPPRLVPILMSIAGLQDIASC